MKAAIAGTGWVTPLGADLDTVWQALRSGVQADIKPVQNPESGQPLPCRPVPPKLVEHLGRSPRLRRSSPVSYFAVAAALAALADAGLSTPLPGRTAVVCAVSDGGVIYTRRFYDQVVKQGANAASPLLFPETVYNAPASHLAAALGLDGASYTLVGDNSIGLTAIDFGAQLLALDQCDRVLVVGCEEIDWILCQAFHDWRLARTPLAEGAGAVVLAREGRHRIQTSPGVPFTRRAEAAQALSTALAAVSTAGVDFVAAGANGTFADRIELTVLSAAGISGESLAVKASLGEAPGASALWQVVAATRALQLENRQRVLVPAVGFNQQAAAAVLTSA